MTHSLPVQNMNTILTIEESIGSKTIISLEKLKTADIINYAIEDEVLEEFIGLLLHIQAKKRKRK